MEFAGRKIYGGVYFGNPEELNCTEQERRNFHSFFIDPTKPVAEKGGPEFDNSLRSHDYGRMSLECRANYLDWLAGGKLEVDCIHYPRLYCIGVEHRYFNADIGSSEKIELNEVIDEMTFDYGWDETVAGIGAKFPISEFNEMFPDESLPFMDAITPTEMDSLISGKMENPSADTFGENEKNPEHHKFLKAIVECADKSSDGKSSM